MKQFGDLNTCISQLRGLQEANDLEPERAEQIALAISALKSLKRKSKWTKADAYACVREVAERIVRALKK